MKTGKIAVFGVPTSAGARRSGTERGPFVLREIGLLRELMETGARVVNLSDLSLFPFRDDPDHARERNAPVVACAVRAAGDEMTRALAEGFTLVLGGDASLLPGVLAGAQSVLGRPVGLAMLSADAGLNTPDTSPSGFLDGMALSLALGRGPREVVSAAGPPPAVRPSHVALLGFRALDPGERGPIGDLGLALPAAAARRLGMRVASALALDAVENEDGPLVVHLDLDVIDPAEMPAAGTETPGTGLSVAEISDLVTALAASPRTVALLVTGYDPERDVERVHARALVSLIVRAAARRLRSLAPKPA